MTRLLDAQGLAELLKVSKRTVFRLNNGGKIPAPVRIGGTVRWRENEIVDWIVAGAPNRAEWERLLKANNVQKRGDASE
jgi:excisionase family DNA binding protein